MISKLFELDTDPASAHGYAELADYCMVIFHKLFTPNEL